jgi:hypothetical protein
MPPPDIINNIESDALGGQATAMLVGQICAASQ